MAVSMEAATPHKHVQIGSKVAIQGLTGAPELNGKQGTVKSWDADKGRWNVLMPGGDIKALKPENLKAKAGQDMSDFGGLISGAIGVLVLAMLALLVLEQSGFAEQMGIPTPAGYVKELFEPFVPLPPQAPEDTVVISFCQG